MKPLISLIRQTKILKDISIVQKRENNVYRNFISKKEFVDDQINKLNRSPNIDTVLHIKCACNRDFIYTEITDIPEDNVICECGQKVIEFSQ